MSMKTFVLAEANAFTKKAISVKLVKASSWQEALKKNGLENIVRDTLESSLDIAWGYGFAVGLIELDIEYDLCEGQNVVGSIVEV